MGRRVGLALGVMGALARTASADEPLPPADSPQLPPPTSAPPSATPAPQGPIEQPAVVHPVQSDGFTVDRHGLMLIGGFEFVDGERSEYAELYIPTPLSQAKRLKLGLTGSVKYQQAYVPDGPDLIAWAYYLQACPQYDWRLPIRSSKGDFAIAVEGGPGVGQLWIRWPDMPYIPPGWEHMTLVTIHADAAFQFLAHNGLVVSLRPVGVTKPIFITDPPSAFWSRSYDAVFELAIGAGYRWR